MSALYAEARRMAEQYPESSSTGLGKALAEKMGKKFQTAHNAIRWVRKERCGGDGGMCQNPVQRIIAPHKVPDNSPFKIKCKKLIVLGDIHIPFHDPDAIDCAFTWAAKEKPDAVLLNGDALDMYLHSDFTNFMPDPPTVLEEFSSFRSIMVEAKKSMPGARFFYKEGNHEERWIAALSGKLPALLCLPSASLAANLGIEALGIEWIGNRRRVRVGGLDILHGHELRTGRACPVSPSRTLSLKYKKSAMIGHYHQVSEHPGKRGDETIFTCWSIGCLCQLSPHFLPINDWGHGFAVVSLYPDGSFHVSNRRIIDGVLV